MLTHIAPTRRIYLYQFLTSGLFFYYWAARSGGEINRSLGQRAVPTAWWFIVPLGGYWWAWQYANALQQLSAARTKLTDTYMFYIIAANAWVIVPTLDFFDFSGNTLFAILYISALLAAAILGHGFFMAALQKKINELPVANGPRPRTT